MCNCLAQVNEELATRNTEVVPTIALRNGQFRIIGVRIMTHKINETKRGKAASLTAAYCPFCGAKYEDESTNETET